MFFTGNNIVDGTEGKIADIAVASVTKNTIGLSKVSNIKDQLNGIRPPNSTDDASKDYSARSIWIDTSGPKAYICVRAQVNNAVWDEIAHDWGGEFVVEEDLDPWLATKTTSHITEGSRLYYTPERVTSHPDVSASKQTLSNFGVPSIYTMNSSSSAWVTIAYIPTVTGTAYMLDAKIVAKRIDQEGQAACYTTCGLYRNTGGVLSHTIKDKLELEEVLGWDITTGVSGTNMTIDVRGENGKIISWKAYVTIYAL